MVAAPLGETSCSREKPLPAIADTLVSSGIIERYDYDYENVYEWFTCRPNGYDYELNVSRKHNEDEPPIDPLGFMLISQADPPLETSLRELASTVQQTLKQTVIIGAIVHKGGDDFSYEPIEKLEYRPN